MDSDTQSETKNSVDAAIEVCSENIQRNLRSSAWEAGVVLLLLVLLGNFVLTLAKMQGEENDQKRQSMRAELADASANLERLASEKLQMEDYQKAAIANAKDKAEDSGEAKEVKYNQARIDRIVELQKAGAEQRGKAIDALSKHKSPPILGDTVLYGTAAVFVVLLGLLAGLYRLHVREVTKNEQIRIGFHRIRIAANNASVIGFGSEVRTSLTQGAFDGGRENTSGQSKKVDSPLPGHPGSDLTAAVLNRLLEQVDVVLQPKVK